MSPPSRSTFRHFTPQLLGVCSWSLCGCRDLYGKVLYGNIWRWACIAHRHKLPIGSLFGRHRMCGVESRMLPAFWHIAQLLIFSHGVIHAVKSMLRAVPIESTNVGVCESLLSGARLRLPYRGDDGEHPREYLAFRVVYDWWVFVASFPLHAVAHWIWPRDRAQAGVNVSTGFSNSPSHCVFGAITTIGLGEEMELEKNEILERPYWPRCFVGRFSRAPGSQSGINVLFPSVRAYRTRGFSSAPREGIMLPWVASSVNIKRVSSANYAFVHAMQSSLDTRFLAWRVFRKLRKSRIFPLCSFDLRGLIRSFLGNFGQSSDGDSTLSPCGKVGFYEPARRHRGLYALPAFRGCLATAQVHMYYL
ncbi:hypothetical protein EDB85DRAFT_1898718 [Lactarius pseudohatsudake]|nr:hypothetical protein EDB85DRAFT_1898718 [Lactarius pseudohatsudake]